MFWQKEGRTPERCRYFIGGFSGNFELERKKDRISFVFLRNEKKNAQQPIDNTRSHSFRRRTHVFFNSKNVYSKFSRAEPERKPFRINYDATTMTIIWNVESIRYRTHRVVYSNNVHIPLFVFTLLSLLFRTLVRRTRSNNSNAIWRFAWCPVSGSRLKAVRRRRGRLPGTPRHARRLERLTGGLAMIWNPYDVHAGSSHAYSSYVVNKVRGGKAKFPGKRVRSLFVDRQQYIRCSVDIVTYDICRWRVPSGRFFFFFLKIINSPASDV